TTQCSPASFTRRVRAASPGGSSAQPSGAVRIRPSTARTVFGVGPGVKVSALMLPQLPCEVARLSLRSRLRPSPIEFEFNEKAPFFRGKGAAVLNEREVIVLVRADFLDSLDLPGAIREFLLQSPLQTAVDRWVNDRHQPLSALSGQVDSRFQID